MIATQKHQQLILLEPAKADLLADLATELKTTKQALLRHAVDNLLAMRGVASSKEISDMRTSLNECQKRIDAVRRKYRKDPDVHRACGEAGLFLATVLTELGERKRPGTKAADNF